MFFFVKQQWSSICKIVVIKSSPRSWWQWYYCSMTLVNQAMSFLLHFFWCTVYVNCSSLWTMSATYYFFCNTLCFPGATNFFLLTVKNLLFVIYVLILGMTTTQILFFSWILKIAFFLVEHCIPLCMQFI